MSAHRVNCFHSSWFDIYKVWSRNYVKNSFISLGEKDGTARGPAEQQQAAEQQQKDVDQQQQAVEQQQDDNQVWDIMKTKVRYKLEVETENRRSETSWIFF